MPGGGASLCWGERLPGHDPAKSTPQRLEGVCMATARREGLSLEPLGGVRPPPCRALPTRSEFCSEARQLGCQDLLLLKDQGIRGQQ